MEQQFRALYGVPSTVPITDAVYSLVRQLQSALVHLNYLPASKLPRYAPLFDNKTANALKVNIESIGFSSFILTCFHLVMNLFGEEHPIWMPSSGYRLLQRTDVPRNFREIDAIESDHRTVGIPCYCWRSFQRAWRIRKSSDFLRGEFHMFSKTISPYQQRWSSSSAFRVLRIRHGLRTVKRQVIFERII